MKKLAAWGISIFGVGAVGLCAAESGQPKAFSLYVDKAGAIQVPTNYRTEWAFLGTWAVNSKEEEPRGAAEFHNVYTQPETIAAYKKTGKFPDGAVLVKELLKARTGPMSTGTISWGNKIEGWFVMIKDTQGRYPRNKLWGDSWGWALFDAEGKVTTKDYTAECIPCHTPARSTDWVYVQGYPSLH